VATEEALSGVHALFRWWCMYEAEIQTLQWPLAVQLRVRLQINTGLVPGDRRHDYLLLLPEACRKVELFS
jgi:hypothetical protein